jgi:hypothetical protein
MALSIRESLGHPVHGVAQRLLGHRLEAAGAFQVQLQVGVVGVGERAPLQVVLGVAVVPVGHTISARKSSYAMWRSAMSAAAAPAAGSRCSPGSPRCACAGTPASGAPPARRAPHRRPGPPRRRTPARSPRRPGTPRPSAFSQCACRQRKCPWSKPPTPAGNQTVAVSPESLVCSASHGQRMFTRPSFCQFFTQPVASRKSTTASLRRPRRAAPPGAARGRGPWPTAQWRTPRSQRAPQALELVRGELGELQHTVRPGPGVALALGVRADATNCWPVARNSMAPCSVRRMRLLKSPGMREGQQALAAVGAPAHRQHLRRA